MVSEIMIGALGDGTSKSQFVGLKDINGGKGSVYSFINSRMTFAMFSTLGTTALSSDGA